MFLPRVTVDTDAHVADLLRALRDPKGPSVMLLRGPEGVGRSTVLRRLEDSFRQQYTPYFSQVAPGVRRIGVLVCDTCHATTATDTAAPKELISVQVRSRVGKETKYAYVYVANRHKGRFVNKSSPL